jgi:hypothetical protein
MLRYDIQIATGKVCFQLFPEDDWWKRNWNQEQDKKLEQDSFEVQETQGLQVQSTADLNAGNSKMNVDPQLVEVNSNLTNSLAPSASTITGTGNTRVIDGVTYTRATGGSAPPVNNQVASGMGGGPGVTLNEIVNGYNPDTVTTIPSTGLSPMRGGDSGVVSETDIVDNTVKSPDTQFSENLDVVTESDMKGQGTAGTLEGMAPGLLTPEQLAAQKASLDAIAAAGGFSSSGDSDVSSVGNGDTNPKPEVTAAMRLAGKDWVMEGGEWVSKYIEGVTQPPRELTQAEKDAGKSWVRDDEGSWRVVSGGTNQVKDTKEIETSGDNDNKLNIVSDGNGGDVLTIGNDNEITNPNQVKAVKDWDAFLKQGITQPFTITKGHGVGQKRTHFTDYDNASPEIQKQWREHLMEKYSEEKFGDKNFFKTYMDNLDQLSYGNSPEGRQKAVVAAQGSKPEQFQVKTNELNQMIARGINNEEDLKKALALIGNTGEGAVHLPGGYKINELGELAFEPQQKLTQVSRTVKDPDTGDDKVITEMVPSGELLHQRMSDPNLEAQLTSVYRNFANTQNRLQSEVDAYLNIRNELAATEPTLQITQKREEVDIARRSNAIVEAKQLTEETGLVYEVKPKTKTEYYSDASGEPGALREVPTGEYEVALKMSPDGRTPLTTMARDKMLDEKRPITLGEGEMIPESELEQFSQQRLNLVSQVSQRIMPQITESLNNINWAEAMKSPEESLELTKLREVVTNLGGSQLSGMPSDIPGEEDVMVGELPPVPAGAVWDATAKQYVQAEGYKGRSFDHNTQKYLARLGNIKRQREHVAAVLATFDKNKIETQLNEREVQEQDARLARHLETANIDSAQEAAIRLEEAKLKTVFLENKAKKFEIYTTFLSNPVALGMAQKFGVLDRFLEDIDPALVLDTPPIPTEWNVATWSRASSMDKAIHFATKIADGYSPQEVADGISGTSPGEGIGLMSYATI